jgi:RNA polymerase sigma-70 factor (ECF subfamily)
LSEKEFLQQVKENQGIIYKVVGLYAFDAEEKKDLYQEILLQCWKGWPSFRGEAKFSTWLYRICLNTVFTSMRRKKIVYYTDAPPDNSIVYSPAIEKEDAALLHRTIRTLAETDRALISLHLDGYGNDEISEMMGITANSVGVKLHRIKQRLTTILNPVTNGK